MESLLEQYYARQKKIQVASSIWNVVANDQNNRMPPAAYKTRADQLSHLNGYIQSLRADPEYVALVNTLFKQKDTLSEKDVRCLLLSGVIAYKNPHSREFLESFEQAKSTSLAHWHKAKKQEDRSVLSPHLAKSFEIAKEYSRLYNDQMDPLSVWCDYSEYMTSTKVYDELFVPLTEVCTTIMSKITDQPKDMSLCIHDYDAQDLLDLLHELLWAIWYDFNQWVLSMIQWPYSENCWPYDERIHVGTWKPLLECILAWLHECGHGLTDMHIDPEYHRTNIHRSVSMGVHESQARGLENMIGRSKPFCIYLTTLLKKYFPTLRKRDATEIYEYLNHVNPGVQRVTADELSYNLHIIIRFELEKEIFSWLLSVENLPARRNELYKTYLGVVPANDQEGCLQDQHWSLGLFWYFPTYALGNIIAGQLRATFTTQHPERSAQVAEGDFSAYFNWHKEHIRKHGNRYTRDEMLLQVTWKSLQIDDFKDYLTQKYIWV